MRVNIIKIGNSRGIRIPKPMLEESGIDNEVDISIQEGEIRIVPIASATVPSEASLLSEAVLASDWNRPEEDQAWESL